MNTNAQGEALSKGIIITPVVKIWSGQVTLKRDELKGASGLPPTQLVSDGSKRIINPTALTKLESQRRCLNRDLQRCGAKTPFGYIVPAEREAFVLKMLQDRGDLFNAELDDFILNYDTRCAEWEREHPGNEDLLRKNRPSAQVVANACSFGYALYRVVPVESEEGRKHFEAVQQVTTGALVDDISSTAKNILKDSFGQKDRVNQGAVKLVRELVAKLKSFSLFDPRIGPTAAALDAVVGGMPKQGFLETSETFVLRALLNQMSDATQLLELGSRTNVLDDADDDQVADEEVVDADEVILAAPVTTNHQPAARRGIAGLDLTPVLL